MSPRRVSADRPGRHVEVLHGVAVADPYRYLEDPDAERTRAFVDAQNALSGPYLAALPARPPLLELTTALLTAPRRGAPWERGGRYFVIANPGELDQDQLFTADRAGRAVRPPRPCCWTRTRCPPTAPSR